MRFICGAGGVDAMKYRKKLQSAEFWTRAAREWHALYAPYVPMDTGRLCATCASARGPSNTAPPTPAAFTTARGSIFRRDRHPLAVARWDWAAEKTLKPELLRRLQSFIDEGGLRLGR